MTAPHDAVIHQLCREIVAVCRLGDWGMSRGDDLRDGGVVSVVKSLWASIQGDPVFMRRVNGWLTIFWILMIPFSIIFGLLSSVSYVSALSLWALVSGHWSAWQAARVEVEQMAEAKELAENPVEKRVVERIIEQTNIAPADGDSTTASAT
jgi:hypothetical protein